MDWLELTQSCYSSGISHIKSQRKIITGAKTRINCHAFSTSRAVVAVAFAASVEGTTPVYLRNISSWYCTPFYQKRKQKTISICYGAYFRPDNPPHEVPKYRTAVRPEKEQLLGQKNCAPPPWFPLSSFAYGFLLIKHLVANSLLESTSADYFAMPAQSSCRQHRQ